MATKLQYTMAAERNTEIWSTRLQRELLALTTDNATDDAKDEVAGVLPPFITVKNHGLDISKGDCVVSFLVDIAKKPKESDDKEAKEQEEGKGAEASADEAKIVVTLDASLRKKSNGSVDQMAVAYPFLKPAALLSSGCKVFPEGSTIKDGDFIDIEMDWTPSLHLTDAILNIGLKIKESILQDEPFHAAKVTEKNDPVEEMVSKAKKFGSNFRKGIAGLTEKSGDTPDGKEKQRKSGLRLGRKKKKEDKKKANKPNPAEIRIGDEINMLEAPWVDCQGVYSCKAIRRPAFVDDAIAVAAQSTEENQVRSIFNDDDEEPDNLGDYMRLQAGSVGQVCLCVCSCLHSFILFCFVLLTYVVF